MCLKVKVNSKIRRLFFGRTCYKVLFRTSDGNLRAPYHLDCVYKVGRAKKVKELEIKRSAFNGYVYEGFHSFVKLEDAIENAMEFMSPGMYALFKNDWVGIEPLLPLVKLENAVVVECRVPWLSRIIEGKIGLSSEDGYVSDRLKVISVIQSFSL